MACAPSLQKLQIIAPQLHYSMLAKAHLSLIPLTPRPISHRLMLLLGSSPRVTYSHLNPKAWERPNSLAPSGAGLGCGRGEDTRRKKYFIPAAIYMTLKLSSQLPAFDPLALLSPSSCFASYCCDCCYFCELLRNASP